jgi:hypothetical protein
MDRTRKFVRQLKAEEKAAKMARDAFELQTNHNREETRKIIEDMELKMKNLQHEKDTMQTIKDEVEYEIRGIISTDRRD